MRVRVSALWDQVASRLGPGNVDIEAAQRAVLRAAGYAWDDVTGELTGWPQNAVVSPGPAERPSNSPARGAACAPVDLTSPDDAARCDDDDATAGGPPRGDAPSRDRPTASLPRRVTRREDAEPGPRLESPVVSIAISDSESGDESDASQKRRRSVRDAPASRGARGRESRSPERRKRQKRQPAPPRRAPSFARASSAQLERELAKHGMKPGPREYMTRELARAWAAGVALPPAFFEPEPPAVERGAGGRDLEARLEDALGRFIKSDVALYDRVLLMETVDVDEVLHLVRRARTPLAPGVAAAKVPRAKLLAYLEREGVAVTHTSSRRARTTRTRF